LQSQGINYQGSLINARRVFDRDGEHVLVLHQLQGPCTSNDRLLLYMVIVDYTVATP